MVGQGLRQSEVHWNEPKFALLLVAVDLVSAVGASTFAHCYLCCRCSCVGCAREKLLFTLSFFSFVIIIRCDVVHVRADCACAGFLCCGRCCLCHSECGISVSVIVEFVLLSTKRSRWSLACRLVDEVEQRRDRLVLGARS